ncbi:MAG: DNA-binding response regulator, partial [Defluviitaleaceae bacterium]|nr:DNA-binding response regulator [Defluviitaleaceae bacterium]
NPRAVDDVVKRLRAKLRKAGSALALDTVWGYGFRLCGE